MAQRGPDREIRELARNKPSERAHEDEPAPNRRLNLFINDAAQQAAAREVAAGEIVTADDTRPMINGRVANILFPDLPIPQRATELERVITAQRLITITDGQRDALQAVFGRDSDSMARLQTDFAKAHRILSAKRQAERAGVSTTTTGAAQNVDAPAAPVTPVAAPPSRTPRNSSWPTVDRKPDTQDAPTRPAVPKLVFQDPGEALPSSGAPTPRSPGNKAPQTER